MNEEYFTTVHGFVRMILLEYDFEEAYEKIAVHMFPLYASATGRKVNKIDIDELYRLGQLLYRLDEDDYLVTSCVSIAVTIQAILFSGGYESDLLIGVKKIDQKLFSHAWVQLKNGKKIDPNNKNEDLKILQIYEMSKYTERWALSSL
jgi:hypothetical protein